MNAAGVSPWPLVRPFAAAAFVVSILLVASIADLCFCHCELCCELRDLGDAGARRHPHQHRAARTFHHGERQSHLLAHRRPAAKPDSLLGMFLADDRRWSAGQRRHLSRRARRDREERNGSARFCVLEKGSVHRLEAGQHDPRIVNVRPIRYSIAQRCGRTANRRRRHLQNTLARSDLGAVVAARQRRAVRRPARRVPVGTA